MFFFCVRECVCVSKLLLFLHYTEHKEMDTAKSTSIFTMCHNMSMLTGTEALMFLKKVIKSNNDEQSSRNQHINFNKIIKMKK